MTKHVTVGTVAPTPSAWQAEVRSREARTVFNSYDRNRSGALEIEELQSCLEDLGLMVRQQDS